MNNARFFAPNYYHTGVAECGIFGGVYMYCK